MDLAAVGGEAGTLLARAARDAGDHRVPPADHARRHRGGARRGGESQHHPHAAGARLGARRGTARRAGAARAARHHAAVPRLLRPEGTGRPADARRDQGFRAGEPGNDARHRAAGAGRHRGGASRRRRRGRRGRGLGRGARAPAGNPRGAEMVGAAPAPAHCHRRRSGRVDAGRVDAGRLDASGGDTGGRDIRTDGRESRCSCPCRGAQNTRSHSSRAVSCLYGRNCARQLA